MRTTFYFFFTILLFTGITMLSCEGPEGPMGPQGPQGEQGSIGPAGEGTLMHAGEGEPANALGEPGDFYLDLTTGELYGPKDETAGWGDSVSLSGSDGTDGQDGADGQDGSDGSQIYAGNGPPPGSLGNVGDYYLDTDNYELYGPKTGRNWDTPIKLQGPPGTANVFYSEWIHADWNLGDTDQYKDMYIEELLLTQDFLDTGAILVYLRHESDPRRIIPLPNYTYNAVGFTKMEYTALVDVEVSGETYNGILISVGRYDGPNAPDPLSSFFYEIKFRYVLIPGGVPAGKIQDGFWEDYENVAGYFGIPD